MSDNNSKSQKEKLPFWGRKEILNYRFLYDKIDSPELKNRVKISLEYFINKATLYKFLYIMFSIAIIVFPAIATFISTLNSSIDYSQITTYIDSYMQSINSSSEPSPISPEKIAEFPTWNVWLLPAITSLTTIISSLFAFLKCGDKKKIIQRFCGKHKE